MKISVITVVRNDVEHIEETVNSVLAQKGVEFEYIIIDGASDDGTKEIIERYRDKIAAFVSEADNGIYQAMNKGIRLATGDVIGLINSGDTYFPGALAAVAAAFEKTPGWEKEYIFWGDVEYESCGRVRGFRPEKLYVGAFAPHPSMFVPRKIYESIGLYDESFKLLGDYDFMYRAVHKYHIKPLYVAELIAFYRAGGVSDRRIMSCLRDELHVKLRYGSPVVLSYLMFFAKVVKNLPRMLLAKMH